MTKIILTPDIRQLAWQMRFQIEKVTRKQSIAEHSYFVAVYADLLADSIGWTGDRGKLLQNCLYHDVDEVVQGDIPTPAKIAMKQYPGAWNGFLDWLASKVHQKFPWLRQKMLLTENGEVEFLVKVADLTEAVCYLLEEASIGNTLVGGVDHGLTNYLHDKLFELILQGHPGTKGIVLAEKRDQIKEFVLNAIDHGMNPNKTVVSC